MAHHGSNPFESSAELRNDISHKRMQEIIGATGRFPEGKLNEEDEGEIKMEIAIEKNAIVIKFGKTVSWVGFNPQQARNIAQSLMKFGDALECKDEPKQGFNPDDVYKDPSIKVIPDGPEVVDWNPPKDIPQCNHSEGVQISLPVYQCFKKVHALKIRAIGFDADHAKIENRETDGTAMILPQDERYAPFKVSAEYVRKHQPQAGGYWIKYEDGYESWSPAEAFEAGYRLI